MALFHIQLHLFPEMHFSPSLSQLILITLRKTQTRLLKLLRILQPSQNSSKTWHNYIKTIVMTWKNKRPWSTRLSMKPIRHIKNTIKENNSVIGIGKKETIFLTKIAPRDLFQKKEKNKMTSYESSFKSMMKKMKSETWPGIEKKPTRPFIILLRRLRQTLRVLPLKLRV